MTWWQPGSPGSLVPVAEGHALCFNKKSHQSTFQTLHFNGFDKVVCIIDCTASSPDLEPVVKLSGIMTRYVYAGRIQHK